MRAEMDNACFAGWQKWQLVTRRFDQSTRKHTRKFWRWMSRDIECFARNGLLAMFGAVFPGRLSILDFESFLDRRFHVIIAFALVFRWHSSSVELPSCGDMIAASSVVIGIFGARRASRVDVMGS